MNYAEWNETIATHFFNSSNAGKYIQLYLTKEDLVKCAKTKFSGKSNEQIWNDYLYAIKYNDQEDTPLKKIISPMERPLSLFATWNTENVPSFIAYLILFTIPLTETYTEHFNATNYYGKVSSFLKKHGVLNITDDDISTASFQHIAPLWNHVEEWSIMIKDCDLGIFELKKFGNKNWKFVGKPLSQCVLPPKAMHKLPELFYEAGMIPNSTYTDEEFRRHLQRYGHKILTINAGVIDLIKNSANNELGQSILETVKREYGKWSGETNNAEEDGNFSQIRRNFTVAPIFLQFKINENEGLIAFSYRIYSGNEYPEDLKFGDWDELHEKSGWSKTLSIPFQENFELKDNFNKWVARFPRRDIRLFVSAGNFQLSTAYWIETDMLSKTLPMYLLCKETIKDSIIEWGKTFREGNFREEDVDGLPDGHFLFKIISPSVSHPINSLLTLYAQKKIELSDGLKIGFRTYINDFLPNVKITNADGNEKTYIHYRGTDEKIYLAPKQANGNLWILPDDTLLNVDFYLKSENDDFPGNEIAYNLICSDDSALKINDQQLPNRDKFGRAASTQSTQYCLGSNIVNPPKASIRAYCPWSELFIPLREIITDRFDTPRYVNHCGNKLLSFLSLKATLSTEEFYNAFEFYYNRQFPNYAENINPTKLKNASLNFYDYMGFLDYEYETKTIVLNPPQLIFIPVREGRTVLLIGARDESFINRLISLAAKHHLQVEIKNQFYSNKNLLLPDAIMITSFGKRSEGSGERNISAFAEELKVTFSQNNFIQLALYLFSSAITEFEKDMLTNNETTQEDNGWARKIFNPLSLLYERNESPTFDKTFSLVEYKLNEYTYYNRLWKNGKCYTVDKNWGKFLVMKNANHNCILFDSRQQRVAIPLETPLPRLLSESIMLLSGMAPDLRNISGRLYRVYENIPGIFTENLFQILGQKPINTNLP